MRILKITFALIAGGFCARDLGAQNARDSIRTDSTRLVRVSVRVPARYDDSRASLKAISSLVRTLPPTADSLDARTNIDVVIFEKYGIAAGPKALDRKRYDEYLPKTRDSLRTLIRELNGLDSNAMTVRAGQVLLPTLPSRAQSSPNGALPVNQLPQIITTKVVARGDTSRAPTTLADAAVTHLQTVAGQITRRNTSHRLIELELPERIARQLLDSAAKGDVPKQRIEVASAPLPFAFEDAGLKDTSSRALRVISKPFLDSLGGRAVTKVPHPHVPLLVLDSGWPDTTAYLHSRTRLRQLMDSVRRVWNLGPVPHRNADPIFVRPQYDHVGQVADAIKPYRDALGDDYVDVIFVPLSRDQGAEPILRELIELDWLLDVKRTGLLESAKADNPALDACHPDPNRPATLVRCVRLAQVAQLGTKDFAAASARADTIVKTLPASLIVNSDTMLMSSSVVVAAAWHLLTALADTTDHVGFLSISFVVPPLYGEMPSVQEGQDAVQIVAAAGNNPNRKLTDDPAVQFAARSLSGNSAVAVLNMSEDGSPLCKSSWVDPAAVQLSYQLVVGFPGITGSGACGTSFAAPRVAWFLALDEALRTKPRPRQYWGRAQAKRILDLRGTGPSPNNLYFLPLRLVGTP